MHFPNGDTDTVFFLDIDDTLASRRTEIGYGSVRYVDPVAMEFLLSLCIAAEGKLVSISRRTPNGDASRRAETTFRLVQAGFDPTLLHPDFACNNMTDDKLPDIAEWLARHGEVTRYLIVDDIEFLQDGRPHPRQVVIDGEDGMLTRHFQQACALMGLDHTQICFQGLQRNQVATHMDRTQYHLEFEHFTPSRNRRLRDEGPFNPMPGGRR